MKHILSRLSKVLIPTMWHGQRNERPCRVVGIYSLHKRRIVEVRWSNMSRPARLVGEEPCSAFAQTKHTQNLTWAFTFIHAALWALKRVLISMERIYFGIWVFTFIHNFNWIFCIGHFPNLAFKRNVYNDERKRRTFVWTLKSIIIQWLFELILFSWCFWKQVQGLKLYCPELTQTDY